VGFAALRRTDTLDHLMARADRALAQAGERRRQDRSADRASI
jgi:hypothetical protein